MNEIVSADNLAAGIRYWRLNKPHWEKDFGNTLYIELRNLKKDGLNETWWKRILTILKRWLAHRPKSIDFINERGLVRLPELDRIHSRMLEDYDLDSFDLSAASWNIVVDLFEIANEIKNVTKPTFPSKLCHFIFPNIYPVADEQVLRVSGFYEYHWERCSLLWSGCKIKDELIEILREEILNSNIQSDNVLDLTVSPHFPWSSKLTELCLIGHIHS